MQPTPPVVPTKKHLSTSWWLRLISNIIYSESDPNIGGSIRLHKQLDSLYTLLLKPGYFVCIAGFCFRASVPATKHFSNLTRVKDIKVEHLGMDH